MGFSLSSIGKMFNDVSGATSAAKMQYKYQKEFAQNAHQWEVKDLEKAGLNPILSADGSGAQGNISAVQGTGGQMATGILNSVLDYNIMKDQNKIAQQDVDAKSELARAETKRAQAQTVEQILKNEKIPEFLKADLAQKWYQNELLQQQGELTREQTSTQRALTEKAWEERAGAQWDQQSKFWEMVKNSSEGDFVQTYGLTKDQAIELYKATGQIIGNLIPDIKPTPNTKGTSAKKQPHFEKGNK